jgi:hypothetical protein
MEVTTMRRALQFPVMGLAGWCLLLDCAPAATVANRRVQTAADTRPFQSSNLPVSGDLGVEATADGVRAKQNNRRPGTESPVEEPSPLAHPKPAGTESPDEDPNGSGE